MATFTKMDSSPTPTPPATPAQQRHRRRRRMVLITTLAVSILLVIVLLIIPRVLSAGFIRESIEEGLSDALGAKVAIESHNLSWFSGFSLEGLRIDNPPGFPQEQPAIVLEHADGDISFWSLIRGRVNLEGTVRGLEVFVYQRADGQSNLAALTGAEVQVDEGKSEESQESEGPSEEGAAGLDDVRLDLKVVDSRVDIVDEEHGLLESLRNLDINVQKEFDRADFRLLLTSDLHRPGNETDGNIKLDVDMDAGGTRPIVADISVVGLDLARYRPLVDSFVSPDQVTAFAGVVGGSGQATVDTKAKRYVFEGNLNVTDPHFAGPLFSDLNLRSDHWVVSPNVAITQNEDGQPPTVEAEKLRVDLGFLNIRGVSAEDAAALVGGSAALGIDFTVDLAKLGELGGPVPEQLKGVVGTATGRAAFDVAAADGLDSEQLTEKFFDLFATNADVKVDGLEIEGQVFDGLTGGLVMSQGVGQVKAGATVGGGPVSLTLNFDPKQREQLPSDLTFAWKSGHVNATAIPWLRYAVPMLAGLDGAAAAADFESGIDCQMTLSGPLMVTSFESALDWLNQWSGVGNVELTNGMIKLAPQLQPLLQFSGDANKRISFKKVATDFTLKNGYVQTRLMRLSRELESIGVTGKTGLDGNIDYRIDLTEEIKRHKDGAKVLQYLGGKAPEATLLGTLDNPQVQLPDLNNVFQQALQQGVEKELKKGLDSLLRRIKK